MASRRGGNVFLTAGLPLMVFIVGSTYMLSQVCGVPGILPLRRMTWAHQATRRTVGVMCKAEQKYLVETAS